MLSTAGVAELRTMGILPSERRTTDISRLIGDAVVLLEGPVVLLVDNDEARSAKGRNSADRAPQTTRTSPSATPPHVRACSSGADRPMPLAGRGTDPRLEALQELARQRNFGQKDENLLLPVPQSLRDGLEIDFGLSRAGHAIEQRR